MTANPFGWQVGIRHDHPGESLSIYRYRDGHIDAVTALGGDQGFSSTIETFDEHAWIPGLRLPEGTLAALREAIGPPESQRELAAVHAALDLERQRVDRTIDAFLAGRRP